MKRIPITPRDDWREQAELLGFAFHTIDGAAYWDERAYYSFTLREVEEDIETATQAVHDLSMQLVDEVVQSEQLFERLAIPRGHWDWIRDSWKNRDPHLYGRMDLAYGGNGPAKLLELNYDTPTALYEAAYFQWLWLEQQIASGGLPKESDQYNRIQELLCEALSGLARDGRIGKCMHFSAVRDSVEDRGTVQYLRDCAHQVGITTASVAIEDIGISAEGWFTDAQDNVIQTLFKLYPLEMMMREEFGPHLTSNKMQLVEPPWKAILSNKGILPLLWERHPDHPNLLPARFDDSRGDLAPGWVRKPMFSREGANIDLRTPEGESFSSPGPYGDGPAILQAFHPLPVFEGNHALVGSWVIADQPAGIGMREDDTLITLDTSRFVPHAIVD